MEIRKISFFRGIGGKILLIFVILSLLTIVALASITLNRTSQALSSAASDQLTAMSKIKHDQMENLFERIMSDVEVVANTSDVVNSINYFINYHIEMNIQATAFYDMSSSADNLTRTYNEIDSEANDLLKKYGEIYGYFDVFLLCARHGHVMYSWAKESDLGENLSAGQYKESGLAEVWRKALSEDKPVLVDVSAYAPSNGAPAMFAGAPIRDQGETIGVFVIQIPFDKINNIIQERTGMGKTGESYLVGSDKLMRSDSYLDPINHSLNASINGTVEKNGVNTEAVNAALEGEEATRIIIDYNGNTVVSSWNILHLGDLKWTIISEIDQAEIRIPINQIITFIFILSGIILLTVIVVTIIFSRSISKPMASLTSLATEIGIGNFDLLIDKKLLKSKDETGALSQSFNSMIESLQYKGNMVEEVAKGNLTIDVKLASDKDLLGNSLIQMTDSLNSLLGNVNKSVDQVNIGADQVSQASQSLSQGATEQASSLEEISASITQINSQSKQNAENATEANGLARQASSDAEKGNREMENLSDAMQKINTSSDQIKKIVKVIDDIAFQTNLLALNANVEAARAGKYGKGFAVVADEVRNLAVRSADAVKETTEMVDDSIRNIESGNKAVEATASQLESILSGSAKVGDFLEEISTASREQAEAIDQITQGLEQIDQVTQSNTASAEESAAAAEELASQSVQLKNMIATFKLKNTRTKTNSKARQIEYQIPEASQLLHTFSHSPETGIKQVDPVAVIAMDDDDFDRF
jgi:methyl-accepting chemotaxis protein